jgi:hypothetical protein
MPETTLPTISFLNYVGDAVVHSFAKLILSLGQQD